MPRLDDLRKSVTKMSTEELRTFFTDIRTDRKIRKEPVVVKKAKVAKVTKTKDNLSKMMAGLTPAQKAELIKQLEGN